MSRKLTVLFWCGLFVAIVGSYLLITDLFSLLVLYRFSSASTHLGLLLARSAFFVLLYAFLVAAGVYVMMRGITRVQPPSQMVPVEQQTSELAA